MNSTLCIGEHPATMTYESSSRNISKSPIAIMVQANLLPKCEMFISKHKEEEEWLILKLCCRVTFFM